MTEPVDRMLSSLPAIYQAADEFGHLRVLLRAFEAVLLNSADASAPAIAQEIDALPSLFAPLGVHRPGAFAGATRPDRTQAPERFLAWLAQWVAFSPYRLFPAERLRVIVAGIVPLYGSRGTRGYLEKLLELCFGDAVMDISIDEAPRRGFVIGRARLGDSTVLDAPEPFRFQVSMVARLTAAQASGEPWEIFESRVRAIVDFARPAHTEYELVLRRGTPNA